MRHYAQLALATSILFAAVGCAQPAATPVAQGPVAAPAVVSTVKADASRLIVAQAIAKSAKPVVKDLGHTNGASVAVSFSTPRAARKVQALQHRWSTSDIQTYQAVLLTADPNGQYTETVATLDIAAGDYNTSTSSTPGLVAFTGLEANKLYKVEVSAWGANSSTAETADYQKMNTQASANAYFNFIEDGNATIEDTPAAQDVTIVLDSYEFNGSATVNATVVEGQFENVAGGITASVVTPTPGLYYLDSDSDVIGGGGYGPDGVNDGHYRYIHNFTQPTTISNFDMFHWDTSGRWDSYTQYVREGYRCSILGVFVNGVAQTQSLPTSFDPWGGYPSGQQPVGTFNGLTVIDLYIPSGAVTTGALGVWAVESSAPYEERNFEQLVVPAN